MLAKMIWVTGNSLCATRSTTGGSTVRACNLQETSFRLMATTETLRIFIAPDQELPRRPNDFNKQELSEEQMAKAVEVAHRAGKRVMVHAEGTEGIKAAVRAGVDSIEHGTMLDDEGAALMAKKGTWLVPTLYTFQHGVELGTSHGQDPISLAKTKEIVAYQQPAFYTRAQSAPENSRRDRTNRNIFQKKWKLLSAVE
jgi:hypothetical protein